MTGRITTYTVPAYVTMVSDRPRFDLYARALRRVVKPGVLVLEIGTGIGVFAILARQLGARVVAVEPSDAINVARLIARENNVGDIEFIHGLSTDVRLPERADVILCDLRGTLPQMEGGIEAIVDARERLLAPGGVLIPAMDTMFAALVEMPALFADRTGSALADSGMKIDTLQRFATNSWTRVRLQPEHLLSKPIAWATVNYRTASTLDMSGTTRWSVERAGTVHGAAVWFDGHLMDDLVLSNAPGQPELIYGHAFFPWPKPVDVSVGDEVSIRFDVRHVGNDYVWRWDSEVRDMTSGTVRACFRQSTFLAQPILPGRLAQADAAHAVALSEEGEIERLILNAMDGATSNDDIAQLLVERFPRRFGTRRGALGRVATVAQRFS